MTIPRSIAAAASSLGITVFKVDPTPPYAPKKKGKVESSVKYVKTNFFAGRDEQDVDDANHELGRWVVDIAGKRVHGTTGKQPLALFPEEEQAELLPFPPSRVEAVTVVDEPVAARRAEAVLFEEGVPSEPSGIRRWLGGWQQDR